MGLKVCCWIHANSLSFPLNCDYHFEYRENHQTFIARLPVFSLGRLFPSFKQEQYLYMYFNVPFKPTALILTFFFVWRITLLYDLPISIHQNLLAALKRFIQNIDQEWERYFSILRSLNIWPSSIFVRIHFFSEILVVCLLLLFYALMLFLVYCKKENKKSR